MPGIARNAIALFDFDGTITTKDSLIEFLIFAKGKRNFLKGLILNLHWLILMKLNATSNHLVKEKIITHFFKGYQFKEFQELCDEFANIVIPSLIRPEALKTINELRSNDFKLVIVSASVDCWIRPWAYKYGFDTIATELEVIDGCLTGKINGRNCHGTEKVTRINKRYNLSNFAEIHAFGDSTRDLQMLNLAHKSFYKPFR